MNFIDKFVQKHRNFGIKNLMMHVSILTMIVFVVNMLSNGRLIPFLYLNRNLAIGNMQIWRFVTFLFIPQTTSIFWILFSVYLYYILGTALENVMGTCRFNLYYGTCALATIIAALVFGGVYTGTYVNMSIFLVFAYYYPNFIINLFFIFPIEVKYLAFFDLVLLAISLIRALLVFDIATILSILAPFAGIFLFFGPTMMNGFKAYKRRRDFQKKMRD
ncbi:MAG: hypothetical protein E7218_00990 [Anaerofustis stercorihominis]|nr:hypothetical protein [Anaerofustis stercorihominis]